MYETLSWENVWWFVWYISILTTLSYLLWQEKQQHNSQKALYLWLYHITNMGRGYRLIQAESIPCTFLSRIDPTSVTLWTPSNTYILLFFPAVANQYTVLNTNIPWKLAYTPPGFIGELLYRKTKAFKWRT